MQLWIRVGLLLLALLVSSSSAGWGYSVDYRIYFLGEETKLSVKTEAGRVYGLKTELLKLAEECFPESYFPPDADEQWLPLRTFWEELGFHVKWVPEVKSIIIAENTDPIVVPPEAHEIMVKAIADTGWLSIKSKQELDVHLSQFYTPELVAKIISDIWRFLQFETDWHSFYQVVASEGLDQGEDWLLVKVTVSESISPHGELHLFDGIIKLQKLDVGWRIDAQYYGD